MLVTTTRNAQCGSCSSAQLSGLPVRVPAQGGRLGLDTGAEPIIEGLIALRHALDLDVIGYGGRPGTGLRCGASLGRPAGETAGRRFRPADL